MHPPRTTPPTTCGALHRFIQECALRGLLVLLDLHRLDAAGGIPDLWYSKAYPEEAVARAWRTMVLRWVVYRVW
jgi:aryl-phospho-beta-D-glucosidase BglC (GH1 family)